MNTPRLVDLNSEFFASHTLANTTEKHAKNARERDLQAVAEFLYRWRNSPNTLRRYQVEISRLWMWAQDQDKLISELTTADLDQYEEFLKDPQPSEKWCSGVRYPKSSKNWRPFISGLSVSSTNHAFNAIRALLTAWLKSGHISKDPMAMKSPIRANITDGIDQADEAPVPSADRWFDESMSAAIKETLEEMPAETNAEQEKRLQYTLVIRTLTLTGARVSEVTGATQSQIYEDRAGWWIKLRGKGGTVRSVPLTNDYISEILMPWRVEHGLPALPTASETTPLFPPRNWTEGRPGITSRMTLNIVKEVVAKAAGSLPLEAQRASSLMRRASNHWFRHTFITSLIDNDVPTKTIMTTVGQTSEKTLRIYDHKQDRDRHIDVCRVAETL
jgi:site-specific recombinase XerD